MRMSRSTTKLRRPYIPLAVRVVVAERQLHEIALRPKFPVGSSSAARLKIALWYLFGDAKAELHHRPALCNRPFDFTTQDYTPVANDPEYLVYLRKWDHEIETRVRGVGAQRSDLGQRRYLKKVARNRAKARKPKRSWPKRRLRKAINARWRWPKRKTGSRSPGARKAIQRPPLPRRGLS